PGWAAAAALEKQPGALELLLLLPQPPIVSPAATTRETPAAAGRQRVPLAPPACPVTLFRSTSMTASVSAPHPSRTPPVPARPARLRFPPHWRVLTSLI